jgi:hypothetical protein
VVPRGVLEAVLAEVRAHCQRRGYREGPGVNNFVPHDAVAAFGMARLLTGMGFDRYVAVAPEGHVYGYFFERLGTPVLSVLADYPPTRCVAEDDLRVIGGQRVLLIEDDVIGGRTLRMVVEHLRQYSPGAIELYLGHTKGIQHLPNVPSEIEKVHLAEDCLDWRRRPELEAELIRCFTSPAPASDSTRPG